MQSARREENRAKACMHRDTGPAPRCCKAQGRGRASGDPSAANHSCQSRRGWCGATQDGARSGGPGLYLRRAVCRPFAPRVQVGACKRRGETLWRGTSHL